MSRKNGYIYLRDHESYKKYYAYKLGKAIPIVERNNTYMTSEIISGKFIMIIEMASDKVDLVEKLLKRYFNSIGYHVYYDGGTEFYKRDIIDEIIPFLEQTNLEFKVLSQNEINNLTRIERINCAYKKLKSFVILYKQKNTNKKRQQQNFEYVDHQNNTLNIINDTKNVDDTLNIIADIKNVDNVLNINEKAKYADDIQDYKNLFNGTMGHADIFVKYNKHTAKLNNKNNGYIFNDEKLIWEEKNTDDFIIMTQKFLCEFINYKINEIIKLQKHIDVSIEVKKMTNVLDKFNNYSYCAQVFRNARPDLIDKDFESKLDTSSHELPIIKGRIIDLRTKRIRNRDRNDLFTFEIDCDYLENNDLEHAKKFFNDIMLNNQENVKYLQCVLGYSLTGEVSLRSLIILYGQGSNGKSVLLEIIQKIMGKKLCKTVDKKVFIKIESNSSHSDHLAQIHGTRIALFSESEENDRLNEGQIKALTGSDEISTRRIYGSTFTFKAVAKYFLITNHKPIFNLSQAMIDRIKYIPFNARFINEPKKPNEFKRDNIFIDQLKTVYLSEVFTFLVNGAFEFYKNPIINVPENIQKVTNENLDELDTVAEYIKNNIEVKEGSNIKKSELYEYYETYCKSEGIKSLIVSKKIFQRSLEQKGYIIGPIGGYDHVKNVAVMNNA